MCVSCCRLAAQKRNTTKYDVRKVPPPRDNYFAALVTHVRAVSTWVFGSDSTLLSHVSIFFRPHFGHDGSACRDVRPCGAVGRCTRRVPLAGVQFRHCVDVGHDRRQPCPVYRRGEARCRRSEAPHAEKRRSAAQGMADRTQVAHLAAAVTTGFSAFHDVSADGTAALTLGAPLPPGLRATMPQGDGGRGQGALAFAGHLGQHCRGNRDEAGHRPCFCSPLRRLARHAVAAAAAAVVCWSMRVARRQR